MAFIHTQSNKDISSLVNVEMVNARQRDVQQNIRVLERIVYGINTLLNDPCPSEDTETSLHTL